MRLMIACDCGRHDTAEPGRPFMCPACGRMWDVPPLDAERAEPSPARRACTASASW